MITNINSINNQAQSKIHHSIVLVDVSGAFQLCPLMMDTKYNSITYPDEYAFRKENGMLYGFEDGQNPDIERVCKRISFKGQYNELDFAAELEKMQQFNELSGVEMKLDKAKSIEDLLAVLPEGYALETTVKRVLKM